MSMLAIKGHTTRGKEVIEILEMLGGRNKYSHFGESTSYFFFIQNGVIDCDEVRYADGYLIYTFEEFLKKFPYKIGDKAFAFDNKCTIIDAVWDESIDEVIYTIKLDTSKYTTTKLSNQLQPYKEETREEIIKIDIPKGYEFAGVDDDKRQVVFEKIGYHYPKTYEECCQYLGCDDRIPLRIIGEFIRLINARNAYWKIAGDEMGLGKPWEPKWEIDNVKYSIIVVENEIRIGDNEEIQRLLVFPTEEMRDAFFENFKDLIEQCKELL